MTANYFESGNLKSYDNMRFGEMIKEGWDYKGSGDWTSQVTNISPAALTFYTPIINDFLVNHCYIYYPAEDDLDVFRVLLNNAIATGFLDQAPTLNMVYYQSIQPDSTTGSYGVFNLQEGGTEGGREAIFNTDFPQAMLDGNIGDYGSDGKARSDKKVKYKPSLNAIKDLNDPKNPYKDAVHRLVDYVEDSGVFSSFIY